MSTIFISVPYVYPLCPLNFNHAKMFVVADVFARYLSNILNGTSKCNLIFPVASHYSGNTAQATAKLVQEFYSGIKGEQHKKIYNLYKNIYQIPSSIVSKFVDPDYLMNYFSEEIIWELQSLSISCDYNDFYNTQNKYWEDFVRAIFRQYREHDVLIQNKNHELAINYDNIEWKTKTIELLKGTDIKQLIHKNNILSSIEHTLSNNWECLRDNGCGVVLDSTGLIVDPMFDSELFMIFDLFIHWINKLQTNIHKLDVFFDTLFLAIQNNKLYKTNNITQEEIDLISYILKSLPCTLFVAEEHLKNWLGKKFYAEQLLIHPNLRTTSYRILGMGLLDGKRMSASRGHTILTRKLIKDYGGELSRLTILLSGGNISKTYNYEIHSPENAKQMLNNFSDYLVFLKSSCVGGEQDFNWSYYEEKINKLIEDGYLRQAIIELLVNIPSKHKYPNKDSMHQLLSFYKKYLYIFIPNYAKCHC